MGKLIFAMAQSLDGYVAAVDGTLGPPLHPPGDALFRHFTEFERNLGGVLYGRRIYEMMRYWDEEQPDWTAPERDFATAWRAHSKWVVSRSLKSVGPNATLVDRDVETFVRGLKSEIDGNIAVAGPELAAGLNKMGLLDEYHLYFRPVVLGAGKPYFAAAGPQLRLLDGDRIGDDTVRLRYEVV
ncbi:MAG TPA: dihydrofolate reductase family protein [Candidatus Baltobacteraceae bacterium]|nr:dihydrofolate reductase family protein [Candidatus Baltobacteraceae bacterium]